jgi:hypothetical protein
VVSTHTDKASSIQQRVPCDVFSGAYQHCQGVWECIQMLRCVLRADAVCCKPAASHVGLCIATPSCATRMNRHSC